MSAERCDCSRCVYCDGILLPRHEHDHFPIPKRRGGESVYPVCFTCHDLKDRIPIFEWPLEAISEAILSSAVPPMCRILLAQLTARLLDLEAANRDLRERLSLDDQATA